MSITTDARADGQKAIAQDARTRRGYILACLSNRPDGMTAEEILDELYTHRIVPLRDFNMVRPRLTELKEQERIEAVGRRKSKSGVATTVWRLC